MYCCYYYPLVSQIPQYAFTPPATPQPTTFPPELERTAVRNNKQEQQAQRKDTRNNQDNKKEKEVRSAKTEEQKETRNETIQTRPTHYRLLETIKQCEENCGFTKAALLQSRNLERSEEAIRLLDDCADACSTMGKYLARDSEFSMAYATLCADICEACGKACSDFRDERLQKCADICLQSAKECGEITN